MGIPFVHSGDKLTVYVCGETFTVDNSSAVFDKVVEAIREDLDEQCIKDICVNGLSIASYVASSTNNNITVKDDTVLVNDVPVHNSITKRIVAFMNTALPFDNLVKFLDNILENPSYQSQQELYDFLEHKDLPLTDDGCFLAYKSVTSNYLDFHTKLVDNTPGSIIPRMKRSQVDDDRNQGCSFGYHVGSIEYVRSFGWTSSKKIVIVKVNPKDVVSVPKDCSQQKCRVTYYEVLKDMTHILNKPMYSSTADDDYSRERNNVDWQDIDQDYDDYKDLDDCHDDCEDDDWCDGWCEDDDWCDDFAYDDDYDNDDDYLNEQSHDYTDLPEPQQL